MAVALPGTVSSSSRFLSLGKLSSRLSRVMIAVPLLPSLRGRGLGRELGAVSLAWLEPGMGSPACILSLAGLPIASAQLVGGWKPVWEGELSLGLYCPCCGDGDGCRAKLPSSKPFHGDPCGLPSAVP